MSTAQTHCKTRADICSELHAPVTVLFTNGNHNAYHCSCPGQDLHDAECQCRCKYCNHARDCPCANTGSCVCAAICDCHCDCCHKSQGATITNTAIAPATEVKGKGEGKKRKIPANEAAQNRECATDGCSNKAPVNGIGGRCCWPCFEKRRESRECMTPDCTNKAPMGGKTGRYCTSCSENDATTDRDPGVRRVCTTAGCSKPAPVGGKGGKRCTDCRNLYMKNRNEARKRAKTEAKEKKDSIKTE